MQDTADIREAHHVWNVALVGSGIAKVVECQLGGEEVEE